ncbi:MAG: anion transporter [Gammaproteobacteria bacterium]|nr:anion transporter [Gammaproteobacteria bacterium]
MPVALIILLLVWVAIALRKATQRVIPIWAIMAVGAFAALVFGQISPKQAVHAIEPDVMLYLFGVFLICQAAETSGCLEQLTEKLFFHAHTGRQALFIIIFALGLSAALLMNDTIAILGTPLILQLCRSNKKLTKPLLYALAFAVTIGSTLSPIGNPQNLLIAVKGQMSSPFWDFLKFLAIPALINLVVAYFFIYVVHKKTLNEPIHKPEPAPKAINHYQTVRLVKLSLMILFVLLIAKIIMDSMRFSFHLNFSYIALTSALPILCSSERWVLLRRLDWGTLIFFASTFVLIQSVWDSGFFQANINHFNIPVTHVAIIILLSVVLSQFISNVPLVALYLPLLIQHGQSQSQLLALAVGSTIAGNLSILGAASNVIITQNAEKRGASGFGFVEFIQYGAPLTLINILVYLCFLK